jgi:hypothetical protein
MNIVKKLEIVANVSIIVVSILLCAFLVKRFVFSKPPDSTNQPNGSYISKGQKVALGDTDWARNGKTLLLVLQKGCHFCSESAPFYKTLVQDAARRGGIHLVAVLPQTTEEGRKYLTDLGVSIDDLRQQTPSALGVKGTPTLILVNDAGEASDIWIGKLKAEQEAEVLSRL